MSPTELSAPRSEALLQRISWAIRNGASWRVLLPLISELAPTLADETQLPEETIRTLVAEAVQHGGMADRRAAPL